MCPTLLTALLGSASLMARVLHSTLATPSRIWNHPILVALKNYIASGWAIRIIPWVVASDSWVLEVWFMNNHCRMH